MRWFKQKHTYELQLAKRAKSPTKQSLHVSNLSIKNRKRQGKKTCLLEQLKQKP